MSPTLRLEHAVVGNVMTHELPDSLTETQQLEAINKAASFVGHVLEASGVEDPRTLHAIVGAGDEEIVASVTGSKTVSTTVSRPLNPSEKISQMFIREG